MSEADAVLAYEDAKAAGAGQAARCGVRGGATRPLPEAGGGRGEGGTRATGAGGWVGA